MESLRAAWGIRADDCELPFREVFKDIEKGIMPMSKHADAMPTVCGRVDYPRGHWIVRG